jgi:hypothetical protein
MFLRMRITSIARVSVALLSLSLAFGCATLGSPPLDEDLITDGSPEAKAALLREYRVAYEDGSIRRPGANDPGTSPSSQAFTDEAYNYLSTSAPARDAIDGSLFVRLDRATRTGVLPALLVLSIPVVVIAGTSGAAVYGYQAAQSSLSPRQPNEVLGSAALYGSLGALATLGGATACWALTSGVLYVLAPFLASGAYRDATAAFNDDLKGRIDRLADPTFVKKPRKRAPAIRIEAEERAPDPASEGSPLPGQESETAPTPAPMDGAPDATDPPATEQPVPEPPATGGTEPAR